MTVKVPGPGVLSASGGKADKDKRKPKKAGKVKLSIEANAAGERKLERKGETTVKPKIKFVPDGGEARTKKKKIELKLR